MDGSEKPERSEADEIRRKLEDALASLVETRDGAGLEQLYAGVLETLNRVTVAERLASVHGEEILSDVGLDAEPNEADDGAESVPLLERLRECGGRDARYRRLGEIARGGMGVILRVWDRELRRSLAMKTTGRGSGALERPLDPTSVARFLEEAQVTGQLDHPGIPPIHELGLDADGHVFFTMRLVHGRTFQEMFEAVRGGDAEWTRARALDALLRACEAVAYAHDKGVVHRDLKPANVMVGGFGEVYVMDWGLAKVLGRASARDLRWKDGGGVRTDARESGLPGETPLHTMDGTVVGTPAYMSPEQALGGGNELDQRSDVYSLGAMLYELLSGHPPYLPDGDPVSPHTVLARLIDGPPAPLGDDVPAELAAICTKAMEREREARYADVSELASDLRAYLEGRVVAAYEAGAWAVLRKWVGRNRSLAAAIGAAIVLAVGGAAGIAAVQAHGRRVADEQRALAEDRAVEIQRFSDTLLVPHLVEEAETLWPRRARELPRFESWLERAGALLGRRALHEDALGEARAAPVNDGERRARIGALTETLASLDAFRGVADAVAERAGLARTIAETTIAGPGPAALWADAVASIADPASPYGGLELAPQVGLVPLGRDPRSGLWEFGYPETGEVPARDAAGDLVLTAESSLVFVLVPGGTYRRGATPPDADHPAGAPHVDPRAWSIERPVTEYRLAPFFLSKYEVTQGQWLRATGENPSLWTGDLRRPVESVSWESCALWLARLDLALCTESQWEAAARGGTSTPWWTGSEEPDWRATACIGRSREGPEPVGSYPPNPFGFHDVLGNVFEWCRDGIGVAGVWELDPLDGEMLVEGAQHRAFRGGCYGIPLENAATLARVSARMQHEPTNRDDATGVRPARAVRP